VTIHLNRHLLAKALRFGLTKIEIIDALSPLKFSEGGRQMIVMPTRGNATPIKPTTPPVSSPAAAQQETSASVPANSPEAIPNRQPMAEQLERKPMPDKPNGHTHAAAPPTNVLEKAALETALAQIEIVRGDFRNAIAGLNELADNLKQVGGSRRPTRRESSSCGRPCARSRASASNPSWR
jgi:hypothetical protein